jgi:type IV pilus assembly protein PilC
LLLVPAAVLVVVAILVRRSPARRSPGSLARLLLRGVLVDLDVAVLATSMTMQLRNSVALDEALDVAADALGDASRSRAARRAAEGVRAGRGAFADDGLASMLRPAELELLSVAERTGGLADQWLRVADLRREQLDGRILRLGSTLEPLLVLLVGLLVGGIILALYLPTFRVLDLL